MGRERLSARELVEKHQEEQKEFLDRMSMVLNNEGYEWPTLEKYARPNDDMVRKGLIIRSDDRFNRVTVLTPQGNVLILEQGRGVILKVAPDEILAASGRGFLQDVENTVATVLTGLREMKGEAVTS